MPETRRMHYVPQFLLAGFTPEGTKDGRLYAHDGKTRRVFSTTPRDAANERDLYMLDGEGVDPQALEAALAAQEEQAAPIIERIRRDHEVPSSDHLEPLFAFLGSLAVRVPKVRDEFSRFITESALLRLDMIVRNPNVFESHRARHRSQWGEDITAEQVRSLLQDQGLRSRVRANPTFVSAHTFGAAGQIAGMLRARRWVVNVVGEPDAISFICSDNPVSAMSRVPLPPLAGPGWGLRSTVAIVPLSSRVALLGDSELAGNGAVVIGRKDVALLNASIILNAQRFIFSRGADLVWLGPRKRFAHASDLRALPREGDPEMPT